MTRHTPRLLTDTKAALRAPSLPPLHPALRAEPQRYDLVDWGVPTMPTSQDDPGPVGWIVGDSILPGADLASVQTVLAGHPHNQMGAMGILRMPGA
jgi:hypothetical protein